MKTQVDFTNWKGYIFPLVVIIFWMIFTFLNRKNKKSTSTPPPAPSTPAKSKSTPAKSKSKKSKK